MDPITQQTALACAGAGGAEAALYVDDVFSTFLYEGDQTNNRQITNGIDLSGEGGLTWIKSRTSTDTHVLYDTERTSGYALRSSSSGAELTYPDRVTFNSDGFDVGVDSYGYTNDLKDYVSWSFRKAPGFFDVVTYTGDGTHGRSISHNLGSVPGCVIIKCTSAASDWIVWHRSLTGGSPGQSTLYLNLTSAASASNYMFYGGNGTLSSTEFGGLGAYTGTNELGETYVAYFFAHDDQSFGDDSDESIIKCGSYTGNGSTSGPVIDLGWEPQWLFWKNADGTNNWEIADTMRGMPVTTGSNMSILRANTAQAEFKDNVTQPNPTGFTITNPGGSNNASGSTYIYIAIRRPHKPPTAGTDVFKAFGHTSSGTTKRTTGFPVDLQILSGRASGFTGNYWFDRLRGFSTNDTAGSKYLQSHSLAAEATTSDFPTYHDNTGFKDSSWLNNVSVAYWNFKRAPGFFDVVAYTGTGSSRSVPHNLGVAPELVIVKQRNQTRAWVYDATTLGGGDGFLNANGYSTFVFLFPSATTSTGVPVNDSNLVNGSGNTYVMYLFATLDGISKVGSYSGTGSDVNVDCGFTAGARFVLIKRTDGNGYDWYVWDTARGIATGNDPYLELNTTDAEVTNTDYIDPLNSGFTVTSSAPAALNASGGTYLFLAIA